jgi:predicted ABC-type transport system involved in lysophospholipase L1 biosynthesis ATPase subunit
MNASEHKLLIEADGIHKTYHLGKHDVRVLAGASVAVREGETVAIVGKSGAGKSTLLHIVGGLDHPDQGAVRIEGGDFYGMGGRRRAVTRATRIGFVFQSYHLLPEMDVLENVMLPWMAMPGLFRPRAAAREHAQELLKSVGLADRAAHRPLELSGGEQQRVALARALMNDPKLILADEPTGNLDDATGGDVLQFLFALVKERNHALILVTHNEKVAGVCHRVLRLADGVLTAVGW